MNQYLKKLFSKFLPKQPEAPQAEPIVMEYLVTEHPPIKAEQAEQVVQEAVEPVNVSPAYIVKEIEPSVYVVEKKSKKKKKK